MRAYGCASTLAFELSHQGQRLIVNCGGAAAAGGLVPVRLEQGLRATAAHSTLTLDDANSTAVLINGMIGTGVSEVDVDRRSLEGERTGGANWGATRLEASHNGYAARYGLIHRRILILRDDGAELRGEDLLVPRAARGKRGKVGFAIRFHLGPGSTWDCPRTARARPRPARRQLLAVPLAAPGRSTIEDSHMGRRPRPAAGDQQLVMQGLVSRGGGNFGWLLKNDGPGVSLLVGVSGQAAFRVGRANSGCTGAREWIGLP
jgi:hypothetical protein